MKRISSTLLFLSCLFIHSFASAKGASVMIDLSETIMQLEEFTDDLTANCLDAAYVSHALTESVNTAQVMWGTIVCLFQLGALCVSDEIAGIVGNLILARDAFRTQVSNCYDRHGPTCGPYSPPA